MSKYYVLLTGSKNNAGDYLIEHRALNLLIARRTDFGFVDVSGWEPQSGTRHMRRQLNREPSSHHGALRSSAALIPRAL